MSTFNFLGVIQLNKLAKKTNATSELELGFK